ncbi:MAG: hypothetical protein HW421_3615 [Ignavibacteria bacterium]|nr:hypothetical protein [Ignavibacteria bacterium]
MKFAIKILLVTLFVFAGVSCTIINRGLAPKQEQTQLQTREFQTRMFDTNNSKLIMKAVLNVLQDDGYVVKNAVVDLGLLTASKEIDLHNARSSKNSGSTAEILADIFAAMATKNNRGRNTSEPVFEKVKVIEVSVNVSEYGRQCKVRANFQAKILDNKGNTIEVSPVDDAKFYQEFFSKVDKGIFLQKQGF